MIYETNTQTVGRLSVCVTV